MINRHDFQEAARHFRAGRISLKDLADKIYGPGKSPADNLVKRNAQKSTSAFAKFAMPQRPVDAHKGDFGRVLVIGGSMGMAGAITLTSLSALKSGTGLVTVVTPESIQACVAGYSPCPMVVGVPSKDGMFAKESIDLIREKCSWADVVAFGPGMGRGPIGQKIAEILFSELEQPVVIDADGLNNIADGKVDLSKHAGLRILTPHPGEFRRLVGSQATSRAEMEHEAIGLALENRLTVLLKGHRTLVTDGENVYRNESGNSGMATAGSGDVLTGIVASLLGQGLAPIDAATTGCFIHGTAGDDAAKRVGEISLTATDLMNSLSSVFKKLAHQNPV